MGNPKIKQITEQKEFKKSVNKTAFLIIAARTARITALILSYAFYGWKFTIIVFLFLLAVAIDNKLNKKTIL